MRVDRERRALTRVAENLFDPEAVFQLIADLRIRNAFLPPTALKMMRAVANPRSRWSYAMRSIASGGEPLGAQLLDWGRETFGLTINEFYGQTECNMVISSAGRLMDPKPGRMGRPGLPVVGLLLELPGRQFGGELAAFSCVDLVVRASQPVAALVARGFLSNGFSRDREAFR